MRLVNLVLSQTLPDSPAKVSEGLLMRQLISVFIDALDAILEPRYIKFLTFSMYLSSILFVGGSGIYVAWLRT